MWILPLAAMVIAQYSPRIVRNFLRDRPNQIVLSVFVATFTYTAAGLYTVEVSAGDRSESIPRAAVSGATSLLFLSLVALVYEVHHSSHSMQIDEIVRLCEGGHPCIRRHQRVSTPSVL